MSTGLARILRRRPASAHVADPFAAYRALSPYFVLDPSNAGTLTGSSPITAARDALGSGKSITGTGLARDTSDAVGPNVVLANSSGTAALSTTTDGPASGAALTMHVLVRLLAVPAGDVGTIMLTGRQGGLGVDFGLRSTGRVWCGNFGQGVLTETNAILSLPGLFALTCTYDGSVCRIYINGVLDNSSSAVSITWSLGYGHTAGSTSYPPPNAHIHRSAWFPGALTKAQISALIRADIAAIPGYATPSALRTEGDSITYGYGLTTPSTQAWPAVALGLINSGRYEPVTLQNAGVSGSLEPSNVNGTVAAYQPRARSSVCTVAWGSNNLNAGESAASIIAKDQAIAAQLVAGGYVPVFATVLPRSSFTPTIEAERQALNTARRGYGYTCLDFANTANVPHQGDPTNTTYYQSAAVDPSGNGGTHPTAALDTEIGTYAATVLGPLLV